MLKFILLWAVILGLGGCTANHAKQAPEVDQLGAAPLDPRATADSQKIGELERHLAERQRQCLAEKRRLELALKESQKRSDDLQKKIDTLLAIDRELRSRAKGH